MPSHYTVPMTAMHYQAASWPEMPMHGHVPMTQTGVINKMQNLVEKGKNAAVNASENISNGVEKFRNHMSTKKDLLHPDHRQEKTFRQ